MKCKLCNEDRKLIEAHMIPKSFHRISSKDKGPFRVLTNTEGEYDRKAPKGVYDKEIVCEDCERKFTQWDDYANELFLQSWEKFKSIDYGGKTNGFELEEYDYEKLKMFFISVLWRAHASKQSIYKKIDLGPKEPILRDAVNRADPGDLDFFGVVLQAFDQTDVPFLDPRPERFFGKKFYRFYLSHVIAYIKVDSQPFDRPFRSIALGAEKRLLIPGKNFYKSPERKIMKEMVMKRKNNSNQSCHTTPASAPR